MCVCVHKPGSGLARCFFRFNFAPGEYIVVINSGGIRAGIPKGPVTLDAVKSIVPFSTKLCLVAANGSTVRAMLEHSVEANEPRASFLVVAGLRFWWNPAKPPLSRVVRVEVRRPCQCGAGCGAPSCISGDMTGEPVPRGQRMETIGRRQGLHPRYPGFHPCRRRWLRDGPDRSAVKTPVT